MADNVTTHEHGKCDHKNYLERQHRTWLQKLFGIKEVYRCSRCGGKITLK